mmetsp:Transcript_73711/g.169013  ORF Transcript_73711/g.169013 Transcript_73711/m.169013 type:complete len:88 (+) Transcript_73711:296-559(+)
MLKAGPLAVCWDASLISAVQCSVVVSLLVKLVLGMVLCGCDPEVKSTVSECCAFVCVTSGIIAYSHRASRRSATGGEPMFFTALQCL